MGLYGRNSYTEGSKPARSAEWGDTGLEESMWHLDFSGGELYPERPGVSDCVYYMQTGLCGFGTRCRYNHPRDRSAAIAAARLVGGEYPERPGEPVCQYYLKTGTCKFGQTCKFNHPRNSGGSLANAPLNYHGYPLRPGEKECSYYLKTGQCKYGIACKFHHPQPAGMSIPAAAPPFYPTVQSPSVPMRAQAAGSSPNYRMSRPPLLPGSFVPGTYPPMLVSPGVVPMPSWTSYSGPVSPALSPGAQPPAGAGSVFGVSPLSPSVPRMPGPYPSLPSSLGLSNGNKEYKLPERPDEPECQYYMKTGSCKFGAACKYHHPPDRASSTAGFFLGPLGLPLRPGAKSCTFYLQNGYCKFGPTCKFDHPLSTMKYSPSSSSLCNIPVAPSRFLAGSSLPTLPNLSFSAELQPDCDLKSLHVTDSDGMQSGNSSVALMFMKNTSMNVEQPSHSMGGHNEVRAN